MGGETPYLNVHECHLVAEEERTRLVCGINQLGDLLLELLRILNLSFVVLGLQITVEAWHDTAIYLLKSFSSEH